MFTIPSRISILGMLVLSGGCVSMADFRANNPLEPFVTGVGDKTEVTDCFLDALNKSGETVLVFQRQDRAKAPNSILALRPISLDPFFEFTIDSPAPQQIEILRRNQWSAWLSVIEGYRPLAEKCVAPKQDAGRAQ
jgi:hypothetical protein